MSQNRLEEIRERFASNKGGYVYYTRNDESDFAYLALINPETNAITGKMILDLEVHIESLAKWKTGKGVILYSASPNFRLGIDEKFADENQSTSFAQDLSFFITKVLMSLSKLPFISVCILSGINEGLGAEIPLYCDYVLMEDNATLIFNHACLGITPGLLGATRLREKVGQKTCMNLLLTCPVLNARAAKKLKIVDDILLQGSGLVNQASEWLSKKLLNKNAIVVQSIKRICSSTSASIGTYGSVFERNSFALLWSCHAEPRAINTLLPISSDESDKEADDEVEEEIDVVNMDDALDGEPEAARLKRNSENNN